MKKLIFLCLILMTTRVASCPTCRGDLSGDGWKKLQDLYILRGRLMQAYACTGFYEVPLNDPCEFIADLWNSCGDMNDDDVMNLTDYYQLRGELMYEYAQTGSYSIACGS